MILELMNKTRYWSVNLQDTRNSTRKPQHEKQLDSASGLGHYNKCLAEVYQHWFVCVFPWAQLQFCGQ